MTTPVDPRLNPAACTVINTHGFHTITRGMSVFQCPGGVSKDCPNASTVKHCPHWWIGDQDLVWICRGNGIKLPTGPAPGAAKAPGEPYLLTRRDRIRVEALRMAIAASSHDRPPGYDAVVLAEDFEDWITRD